LEPSLPSRQRRISISTTDSSSLSSLSSQSLPSQWSTSSKQASVADEATEEAITLWLEEKEARDNDNISSVSGALSNCSGADQNEPNTSSEESPPEERTAGYHDVGSRIQALTLIEFGIHHSVVTALTNVSKSRIYSLRQQARDRGYDPTVSKKLLLIYVADAPRSGRPPASQQVIDLVISVVTKNSWNRGWSTNQIAQKVSEILKKEKAISPRTVYRILKSKGYSSVKRTVKPGLKDEDKKKRLAWCWAHRNWTLEDWKRVIWTDETSVQLSGLRGKRRIWRLPSEAFDPHCIRRRWKGKKEFMFWGSFSWDFKGPCHIWKDETKEEKKYAKAKLAELNAAKEENDHNEWDRQYQLRRENAEANRGQRHGGRRAVWKHTKKTGLLERASGKGGIDWWRHQQTILLPKLFPFAHKCKRKRLDTLVMEDNAAPHAALAQKLVYKFHEIKKLLWGPNSPDLNAIEPTWAYMKRTTTDRGGFTSKKTMESAWLQCWKELSQKKIRQWIERIYWHVQEVIRLRGGNEYKEGRKKGQEKVAVR
jgi:transposase